MVKNNAPKETTEVAIPDGVDMEFLRSLGGGALESLKAEDVIMPRFKLVQNTSKVGTPGKYICTTDPDLELDELHLIILDITTYRAYFPPVGQGNDKPLCKSNDGMSKSSEDGIGDRTCDGCRYNVWVKDDRTGKSTPPPCKSGYTLVGIVRLSDGSTSPAMVSFKGTAIRPIKQYFTRMKAKGIASFAYETIIGSVSEVNDKGRFFKPTFDFGPMLERDEIISSAEQARSVKQFVSRDLFVDEEREEETSGAPTAASDFMASLENTGSAPVEENNGACDF